MHWLNQAFTVPEGYLANQKMVHCLVPVLIRMLIVKAYLLCTAWYPY